MNLRLVRVVRHVESVAVESHPFIEEVTAGYTIDRLGDRSATHLPKRMTDIHTARNFPAVRREHGLGEDIKGVS